MSQFTEIMVLLAVGLLIFYLLKEIMPSHTHRETLKTEVDTLDSSDEPIDHELEKQKYRAKMMQEEFSEIMNYDLSTAYKRKGDIR